MIVLLSPAKSLEWEKEIGIDFKETEPVFQDNADYLVSKLQKLSARQIKKLMSISDDLADLNFNRFQNFFNNVEEKRASIFAFNGDVYRGLDAYTLSDENFKKANECVRILSGLYGLLKPSDIIKPYRLEMGSSFKVTAAKNNLYKYWADDIAKQLKEELSSHSIPVIFNAASNEYNKAVLAVKSVDLPIINVEFKENKDGKFKVIGFFAKYARGLFARYLIESDANDVESLKSFNADNYAFNAELSDDKNWVFTR